MSLGVLARVWHPAFVSRSLSITGGTVTWATLLLLIGLAAANGANDVSKGVATLAGAGVTAYRTAILWGAATTFAGALISVQLGRGMGKLFSKGIVDLHPTSSFALAVLAATAAWVALASVARLPVSTTHALVGSLVGAGMVASTGAVQWHGVVSKVLTPLLLSIAVAYGISVAIALVAQWAITRGGARLDVRPGDGPSSATGGSELVSNETGGGATRSSATAVDVREDVDRRTPGRSLLSILHWISSGATSCARGLNDTPKIAAVGGFALIPAGYSSTTVSLIVAVSMTAGALLGVRVARTLGEGVVQLGHRGGFIANLTTAGLVGSGALLALPMSTTHVSTGAIVGSVGGQLSLISRRTLRDFVLAWTVTPVFAATVAAVVYAVAK